MKLADMLLLLLLLLSLTAAQCWLAPPIASLLWG
jgi:hypothetical protein